MLLVAGGSGVVPLMAMLRHHAATCSPTATLFAFDVTVVLRVPVGAAV